MLSSVVGGCGSCGGGGVGDRCSPVGPWVLPVDVAQVPTRLNHVAHPPLQLLGLGKAAVDLAVPESVGYTAATLRRRRLDLDDEGPSSRGLQGYLSQRRRERG